MPAVHATAGDRPRYFAARRDLHAWRFNPEGIELIFTNPYREHKHHRYGRGVSLVGARELRSVMRPVILTPRDVVEVVARTPDELSSILAAGEPVDTGRFGKAAIELVISND